MIRTLVVVGTQWGDEGKGKIVYLLGKYFDYIVRYQGGDNAGHTVIYKGKPFIFHLVPSGIFIPGKKCVIGNGVVMNPQSLYNEISMLKMLGVKTEGRVFISEQAHVILPYHNILDEVYEQKSIRIGTTKRGIGPCYADKYKRIGIRVCDFFEDDVFFSLVKKNIDEKESLLTPAQKISVLNKVKKTYKFYRDFLKKYTTNTVMLLNEALDKGKRILFEGAQGTMLDVDFGTYPFVTSSNPVAGYASIGSGIGVTKIDYVLGVTKAYTTRVGEGPFPTEMDSKTANMIREKGLEYGATTGRPRRCGWFDAVVVRYSIVVNGINSLALTKLDCLCGMKQLLICYKYALNGKDFHYPPASRTLQSNVKSVYYKLRGFEKLYEDISQDELNENAKSYIEKLQEVTNCKVSILSFGREKIKTVFCDKNLFKVITMS